MDFEKKCKEVITPYFEQNARPGSFTGKGGKQIRYAVIEQPNAKGALVIINGRTEPFISYLEIFYELRDSGFSIYTMDHRGQGYSDRLLPDSEKGHVENHSDYTEDIKTFIDTVVNNTPHKKLFALAHSMGGGAMTLYAQLYPNDFDGIILSAPMHGINTGPFPSVVVEWLVWFYDLIGKGDDYAPGSGGYSRDKFEGNRLSSDRKRFEMKEGYIFNHPELHLGGPTVAWVKNMRRMCKVIRQNADQIKTPMLLLQAGADKLVRLDAQNLVCEKAADCTKVHIENSQHEILFERDEIRVRALDEIRKFINSH